jgi:hypothetical protein
LMQPMHPAACTRELRGRQTVQAKGKEANEGLLHYQRAAPQFRARPPARRRPGPRRPPGYNQLPSGGPSPPLRPERARQVNPRIHRQSTARTRIWRTPAEEAYGLTGCCRQLARGRASPPAYSMTISAGRSCVDDHDHRLRQQARQAQTPTRALHVAVVEFTAALPRARRRPVRQLPTPSVHAQARRPPVLPPPPAAAAPALAALAAAPLPLRW